MNQTSKLIFLIVVGLIVIGVGFPIVRGALGSVAPNQATPAPVASPAPQTHDELVNFVKQKLISSCRADPQQFRVIVTKSEPDYAFGQGACSQPGPGFYWAAAKVNGAWSYFLTGNGIPKCNEVDIFPSTALDGQFKKCLGASGDLVDRP